MLAQSINIVNSEKTKFKFQKSYNMSFHSVESNKKQFKNHNFVSKSFSLNQFSSF